MSRIGNLPVPIPTNASIKIDGSKIMVKGPLGELKREVHPNLSVSMSDDQLKVERSTENPKDVALHGLWRSLINNMVVGVTQGFELRLELIGTGYRAQQRDKSLELTLGFSHTVPIKPLKTNILSVQGGTQVIVKGIDKEAVGQQAAVIRALRKPNPFTGKGVKYSNEVIRRKAGKTGA